MPNLTFVLPHWMYWLGLVVFPLFAMFMVRWQRRHAGPRVSLPVAYLLLLAGGMFGVHRLYLKSRWSLVFIVLVVALLEVNTIARGARDVHSEANNAVTIAEFNVKRAQRSLQKERRGAGQQLTTANEGLEKARQELKVTERVRERWADAATALGGALLLLIIIDALLLPRLVRRRLAVETEELGEGFRCPVVEQEHDDSREPFRFNRFISRLNGFSGELVAYWSVIAVFVYYYEVVARYLFNSPTNWAHESMFLMFGAQYLIAGGFCLRENAHVRVDVIYTHLPKRAQAIMDLITSIFFFIFVVTLLVTGWIFFRDAFSIREVSFTEWGIQYWPVKFALPMGAVLLLIQGLAQLVKDFAVVLRPASAELDVETRPEG